MWNSQGQWWPCLEIPQYVAYQKNVVYAFTKIGAKSHSFNIWRTMDGLSCPTILYANRSPTLLKIRRRSRS